MSNPLLASMAATMCRSRIPYGLVECENFSLLHLNDALNALIKDVQLVTGRNLMRDFDEINFALRSCYERNVREVFPHAESGLYLEITPVQGEDGKPIALQCIPLPQDETHESDRRHSIENQFKRTLEDFPLNVWMCSPKGELFWINNTSNRFSHEMDELLDASNTYWMSKIPSEDLEKANEIFGRALTERVIVPYRYRVRDNYGKYHWHLSAYKPIVNDAGEVLHWVGAGINIQQFVETEEQLLAQIKQLQEKSDSDKKLLWEANSLLAKSQKLELVSNLAGGVAHDLNNLLFIMSLNADLLYKQLEEPHLKGAANNVRDTIKKAARLSSALMGFSGRKPQSLSSVDPKALIDEIKDLLEKAVGRETDFSIRVEKDTAMIMVDKMYLENSLINLAINARDAVAGRGSVVLSIGNCTMQRGNNGIQNYVYFKMHDDGMGMPPEVIANIYEPFFTTKAPGKGTGLGLPMVKTFVESSNGFMDVDSISGVGTTFSLYLPQTNQPPLEHEVESALIRGGTESILIVDDDVGVRDSLANALKEIGYPTVRTAFNAEYALQFLAGGFQIDLIISDVMMPGRITIPEFISRVQELKRNIPIIFATGYSADVVVKAGLINDQYPVLHKPFSMHELSSKIREALDAHAQCVGHTSKQPAHRNA